MIWLYNRTGEDYLIDLLKLLHNQGHDWIAQYADFQFKQKITAEYIKLNEGGGLKDLALATHGVNNGQGLKTAAVWSLVSGSRTDRAGVAKMLEELDQWHGLPNGMFSCDEHLAGRDPSQGSELCTVVETMFSLEQAFAITGDVALADRLEKLAYNALPGTLTDDMWAHQYNQEPNQVECSLHHKPWVTDGPESNLFGLEPNFGCCTANFHQGWPKLAASLFMVSGGSEAEEGLVAGVYAPCEVSTRIRGVGVRVEEETEYPFRETVRIRVNPASTLRFPLSVRIPSWAQDARISVNGVPHPEAPRAGTLETLDREWAAGDSIELRMPMQPRVSRWFQNSAAVERGPLVFSLGIGESWVKLRDRGLTADWQVFPTTEWSYALEVDGAESLKDVSVSEAALTDTPFTRKAPPVAIRVAGRRFAGWRAEDGAADPLPESPVAVDGPKETLELVPYAAAKLRVTAFPVAKV